METDRFSSYKICKELNLIICNYQGVSTMSDVISLNKQFTTDPDYDPEYDVFTDFSDSKSVAWKIEVGDYVEFFRKSVKLKNKVRVGNLYGTPNQDFLLKVYKGFGKVLNLEIENFYYFDDYIQWIKFDSDQKNQLKGILLSIKSDLYNHR